MKAKRNGFYNPRGMSPRERALLDNALAGVAADADGRADIESALVEIADMVATQDDALVELAELIGE